MQQPYLGLQCGYVACRASCYPPRGVRHIALVGGFPNCTTASADCAATPGKLCKSRNTMVCSEPKPCHFSMVQRFFLLPNGYNIARVLDWGINQNNTFPLPQYFLLSILTDAFPVTISTTVLKCYILSTFYCKCTKLL